jgi:hypothetical protein
MNQLVPTALLTFASLAAVPSSACAQEALEEALLQHPTPGERDPVGYPDAFGYDVDIAADGSRAVVGAPNDDTDDGVNAGTAYLFARVGTTWTLEATLAPEGPSPAANQQFGVAVAMSPDGSRVAVGRPGADAASVSTADAASARDAGAPPLSSSGCGCAVPASRNPSTHAALLALAFAAMVLARLDRHRSRVASAEKGDGPR